MKRILFGITTLIFLSGCSFYSPKDVNPINTNLTYTNHDSILIEIYAKQFQWTVRYSGKDNILGDVNTGCIGPNNELGIISRTTIENQIDSINNVIEVLNQRKEIKQAHDNLNLKREQLVSQKSQLNTYLLATSEGQLNAATDDIVTKELHLPVGKQILFKFRSQDVIHSAYIPHFKLQMNCVPGVSTQFSFIPTKTTQEIKKELNNDSFEYFMICNKICGEGHYNMRMKVVVETEEKYNEWLEIQAYEKSPGLN